MREACHVQASGGVLRTKSDTYAAASRMIATLGDRWSEFLPPSAFRRVRPRLKRCSRTVSVAHAV